LVDKGVVRYFGLSEQGLRDALAHGSFADKVRRDFLTGVRSGVNGTPTFFINNLRYGGPVSYEALVDAIAAQLEYAMAPA
jgi:protein-disulfide isomerase